MGDGAPAKPVVDPTTWYAADYTNISDIDEGTRKLLQNYSHIPEDELLQHVNAVRKQAFAIYPYPCIGQWRFLDLSVGKAPRYDEVLKRVKAGETFLDLGCCFGQDIRKVVADGAPSENCYGSDLRPAYFESGYDLFRDRDTLKSTFIVADALEAESPLDVLDAKINIINASSFFHLFDWNQQVTAAKRCVRILRREKGSMVVGRQVGDKQPGEKINRHGIGSKYRHDEASFKKFWLQVGEETGTKWDVYVKGYDMPEWWFKAMGEERRDNATILMYNVRMA